MSHAGQMITLQEFERRAMVHMDAAYNLAYWLLRDREDAQDAVQDAYLRAFRAYGSVVGADIKPWLLTIVRHVAYRWLSARKRAANVIAFDSALPGREDEDGTLELASDEPSPEDLLVTRAQQMLVRNALAELPAISREVIVLREFEDMSYQEIATITGVPIGTVMSRLGRAREQLRLRLGPLLAAEHKNAL